MGATLPTLARAVVPTGEDLARKVGWLYAINTFGGTAGTLAAGFFALEHLGIRGTIWLGAAFNLLVAAAAFVMSSRIGESTLQAKPPSEKPTPHNDRDLMLPLWQAMGIVTLAGMISMSMEVVWTRALVFYVHNSTYAFSAILAVYLLGLALGAGVAGRLSRGRTTVRWLGWILLGICLSSVLAIATYRHLPALVKPILGETLAPALAGLPDRSFWIIRKWSAALTSIFLQSGAVLFLPALLFGMVFLVIKAAQTKEANS